MNLPYEQIPKYEKRLLSAITSSDTKVMNELLHDDLIFNIPTGQTITNQMI